MKKLLLLYCGLLGFCRLLSQPLNIGDTIPGRTSLTVLHDKDLIRFSDLRGKIVVLEFWATWCGPCIGALQHFEQLQKKYGNRLTVLAISGESSGRLRLFIQNKKPALQIISDTAGIMAALFPHRLIPHTVLIDKAGKVQAVTDPANITDSALDRLLSGYKVALPVKRDKTDFDLAQYFQADTTKPESFIMRPPVAGIGTFTKVYPNSTFANRRITIVNATRAFLYRLIYGKSYFRSINFYEDDKNYTKLEKFCIDSWIAQNSEVKLRKFLRKQLSKYFIDVDARLETKRMKVFVIKAYDSAVLKLKPATEPGNFAAGGGFFNGKGVKIESVANYLEDFGIMQKPVIDKTGLTGYYTISFEWQPEERSSLHNALNEYGLYLEEQEELIEVLVIRKKVAAASK
jgi:thiol-disulfide isomerase/thioredoxin